MMFFFLVTPYFSIIEELHRVSYLVRSECSLSLKSDFYTDHTFKCSVICVADTLTEVTFMNFLGIHSLSTSVKALECPTDILARN